MTEKPCPFCSPDGSRVFLRRERVFALWDGFPVSPGHALIVPHRHVADWLSASTEEQVELTAAINEVCNVIRQQWDTESFNIGINIGAAAGQTVPHLHVHVIPRRKGDVPDPRGGVRHVIPGKGNYLTRDADGNVPAPYAADAANRIPPGVSNPTLPVTAAPNPEPTLTTGLTDSLIGPLERDIAEAEEVAIAVAFVLKSGTDNLIPHLRELLERGGSLRFLTGDYLGVSDPDALQMLVDLQRTTDEKRCLVKIFATEGRSFHPKAYLTSRGNGSGVAYVGSSNVSRSALVDGVEWNYRVTSDRDRKGWLRTREAFGELFDHPSVVTLSDAWIRAYRARRPSTQPIDQSAGIAPEAPSAPPSRNTAQKEALAALEATREKGNRAGLVVMATGVGKTWLAAFDAMQPEFKRVLFVAHREEILKQALMTFRRFGPDDSLGLYIGDERAPDSRVLFASIQTLSQRNHLSRFRPDEFDYIVIDEFHHAAAATYRRLIDHFQPKFLLGLTATPERADGGDLLGLCDENLVYRCSVRRGIELDLLCSFKYFGVPDTINYANIPWKNRRFDEERLTAEAATQTRAANIFSQWQRHKGERTVAFCVSQRHADFMKDWFLRHGVACAAVHSGKRSDPRTVSLERLATGKLKVVFAVDMFNEGVDIPAIDTVLMLRPTESQVVWLQQFGRGLRKHADKVLTVIDYIGNHRSFLVKVRALLGLAHGSREQLLAALSKVERREFELPPNCEVTYELEAMEILRLLLPAEGATQALKAYYEDFRERHGQRPTATEAFHDGYLPGAARADFGSWFGLVDAMGDLEETGRQALEEGRAFLTGLETTSMTKSYKMLVLLAMLDADTLPGPGISLSSLAEGVVKIARRSAHLQKDLSVDLGDVGAVCRLLMAHPVAAWTGTGAVAGRAFFVFEDEMLKFVAEMPDKCRTQFQEMVRELAEWRLAQYLSRRSAGDAAGDSDFVAKVSHTGGRPIVFLPKRDSHSQIPSGKRPLTIDNDEYEARFAKVALNVVTRRGEAHNRLPELLRRWFGTDAGLPGTNHRVRFELTDGGWTMKPCSSEPDR